MNSNFLNNIGLGNLDIGYVLLGMIIVILILLIMIIVQMVSTKKLKKKYQAFMKGKDAKSLEKSIIDLNEDNKYLMMSVEKNKKDIRTLFKKSEIAFQKMGIVKYDAFQQMGGQLSFSLALLDENNDGFIINSVHSSEGCYSYTKEIVRGECSISLGEEEKKALNMAMSKGTRD